jgi:DNA primase
MMAMQYFYEGLKKSPKAIDYFKSREITPQIAREFWLGYAAPGWTNFVEFAQAKGVSVESLVACGLATSKAEGGGQVYDRFRDRVIFPIFDISGRPIAFAARGLEADAVPKYLNSPETPLYHKNRTLYGIHKARPHIKGKDSIIIVEGYMDYLALYQAGIGNVVATCGTALSAEHGNAIRRFTPHVYLVFDGDSAGITAAQRGVFILAPLNLDVRVLVLAGDEDPDSYVKKHGGESFAELLRGARSSADFIIEKAAVDSGAETAHGKSAAVQFLIPLIESIPDTIVREDFVRRLAERLKITERIIYGELSKRKFKPQGQPEHHSSPESFLQSLERNFFRLLVQNPELIDEARGYISPETFTDPVSGNLYSSILAAHEEKNDLSTLMDKLENAEEKSFAAGLLTALVVQEGAHDELLHTIIQLQKKFLKYRLRDITGRLKKEPQNRGVLLEEHKHLTVQLKELEKNA